LTVTGSSDPPADEPDPQSQAAVETMSILKTTSGRAAMPVLTMLRRRLRDRGWELRRTDPDRSLGEHLWHLFPYLGINCVLDVGAGSGEYGSFLRQNGYTGQIVSFEPVESSFRVLAKRCEGDPAWRAFQYALGAECHTGRINVTRNPTYSSFLQPSKHSLATFAGSAIERTESVEVRRLDDVLDDVIDRAVDPRLFVKLGPQGWDLEVLQGAERRLSEIRALHAQLSFHPMYDGGVAFPAAVSSLARAGFAVSGVFDRPHHHGFRLADVDCVMIRPTDGVAEVMRRW
jgi:FkbM family methyltransferase